LPDDIAAIHVASGEQREQELLDDDFLALLTYPWVVSVAGN
jgi:hypothetical protein